MKSQLLIFCLTISLLATSQENFTLNLHFYKADRFDTSKIRLFDSLVITSEALEKRYAYDDLTVSDTAFLIKKLSPGTYKLKFISSTVGYSFVHQFVVICGQCGNVSTIFFDLNVPTKEIDLVKEPMRPFAIYENYYSPYGARYNRALKTDFVKDLKGHEISRIKNRNFSVSAFVIGSRIVEHHISGKGLKLKDKRIISKGINNLTLWKVYGGYEAQIEINSKDVFPTTSVQQ